MLFDTNGFIKEIGRIITSGITSKKRILLIENTKECAGFIQTSLLKTGIDPHIVSNIQNGVSQMMIYTFDVVALNINVEGAVRLINLLLDLRHAKNTLSIFLSSAVSI